MVKFNTKGCDMVKEKTERRIEKCMKIDGIEVEAIVTEKTSALVTEALLKLYDKNPLNLSYIEDED